MVGKVSPLGGAVAAEDKYRSMTMILESLIVHGLFFVVIVHLATCNSNITKTSAFV